MYTWFKLHAEASKITILARSANILPAIATAIEVAKLQFATHMCETHMCALCRRKTTHVCVIQCETQ